MSFELCLFEENVHVVESTVVDCFSWVLRQVLNLALDAVKLGPEQRHDVLTVVGTMDTLFLEVVHLS